MNIYGYSERGMVNSIAYFLDANSQAIFEFLKIIGIPLGESDYDYTIFIEQSFSDFGDSDLIIIIIDKVKSEKTVVFIECKIKTYLGAFQIKSEFNKIAKAIKDEKKITGISSNLFVQLYYKHLLIKTHGNSANDTTVNKIFKKSNDNPRVLGSNKIVLKAFNEITNANNYYYAAIVPTATNEMDNKTFKDKIDDLALMPSENAFLCYWGDVENYFKKNAATKILETFKYNDGQIY
jgi:hypothetical protein